ncbi:LOW QUALITY PROTEIN: semaphorin-4A-like [Mantella aurantiaca]
MMPGWVMSPHWLVLLLVAFVPAFPADLLPRIVFPFGDSLRSVSLFSRVGMMNFDQFLLDDKKEILYVGTRGNILELSLRDPENLQLLREVSWPSLSDQIANCRAKARKEAECHNFIRILQPINETHLYVCGTNAFRPSCTYVILDSFSLPTNQNNETLTLDGRGQSPFDPQHKHTEILVDGELYTGTMYNFMGNEPIIFRTLGSRTSLKTDSSLSWLHSDTSFSGSFYIPGSASDGKIYFFFTETGKEFDFFDRLMVPRVARVCKNDVGGDKVLQKKWTTFLKAQLVCNHGNNIPFNVMHHMALLHPENPELSVFYGVFSSQWHSGGSRSSAICSFRLAEVEATFNGNYKEQNKESSKWTRYTGHVSDPRPGSCSSGKFSDSDLNFMKDHFLMDDKVFPVGRSPLLIQQSVSYTRIAIDSVPALSGDNYTVLFLGTEGGALHKVVLMNGSMESHIIEELRLVKEPEPIETLLVVPNKKVLYVGTTAGILQVPVANCSVYRSCMECVLARDPYCAWSKTANQCQSLPANPNPADWLQDVETGNPNISCLSPPPKGRAPRPAQDPDNPPLRAKNYTVPYNTILNLECPQTSSLAAYSWRTPGRLGERQIVTSRDGLIVIVRSDTLGFYECWADENGFSYKAAQYWVKDPNGAPEDPENGISFSTDEPNYYKPFVAVTVLLALTLSAGVFLVLYSSLDRITNRKIQGCSTPETEKLSAAKPENTPLNGLYQHARNFAKPCCVPIGGTDGKMDLDNNSVNLMPNGGMATESSSDV